MEAARRAASERPMRLKTRWVSKRPGRTRAWSISVAVQLMVQMIWSARKSPSIPSERFKRALTISRLSEPRASTASSASSRMTTRFQFAWACLCAAQKPMKSGCATSRKWDGLRDQPQVGRWNVIEPVGFLQGPHQVPQIRRLSGAGSPFKDRKAAFAREQHLDERPVPCKAIAAIAECKVIVGKDCPQFKSLLGGPPAGLAESPSWLPL